MKKNLIFFLALLQISNCTKPEEFPLTLPAGAEPSAKSFNDYGIEDFHSGKYSDSFLHFKQASVADPYAGEIYFNKGLALHMKGKRERAYEEFKKAKKYSKGSPKILKSKVLKNYFK